jgi:hypothetical protein
VPGSPGAAAVAAASVVVSAEFGVVVGVVEAAVSAELGAAVAMAEVVVSAEFGVVVGVAEVAVPAELGAAAGAVAATGVTAIVGAVAGIRVSRGFAPSRAWGFDTIENLANPGTRDSSRAGQGTAPPLP